MLRIVIIDDEQNARELISNTVKHNCSNVEIVGTGESVKTGLEVINAVNPDIVLLDVQMPDGTGFDLLSKLKDFKFKVIFITAHQEFALQAFKFSALNYILKPVDVEELVASINKVEEAIEQNNMDMKMKILYDNLQNKSKDSKKLILKSTDQIHAVNVKDIIRCESEGNYTRFILNDGRKLLATKILKEFDEMLQNYNFFRVHQSHLINVDFFETFIKADGGTVVMKDKSKIPLASRKKEAFLKLLSSL
jgi:two-component system, LytTR family, response regulator